MIDYQIDASSLFAVKMYAQQFLGADRQVFGAFPYSLCHTHATGLRHVQSLVSIPALSGIEIHLDRETSIWEKESILAICRTIQEHDKTIVIWGEFTPDELSEFQNALEPGGLAINYWEPEQA